MALFQANSSDIKTDTFSGTSNSNGNIVVRYNGDRTVLGICCESWTQGFDSVMPTTYNSTGTQILAFSVLKADGGKFVPVNGDTITGRYWYVDN